MASTTTSYNVFSDAYPAEAVGAAQNKPAAPAATDDATTLRGRRVGMRDLASMSSQLAIMTRSGLTLASALESLARKTRHPRLRAILHHVHEQVLGGRTFSSALSDFEQVFGPTYVASVAAGEASGKMADVLGQLSQLQRRELRLRSTIRTLLAYPVVLSTVSLGVTLGLLLFVLPQFAAIFERYEMPLPILTSLLLGVAGELRARFWLWLPLASAPLWGLLAMQLSISGRRFKDWLLLHVIVIRDVTRVMIIGRLCRLLGLTLQSGVPLVESLRLVQSATKNLLFQELFVNIEDSVVNGGGFGECLANCDFLPDMAADMLATAEQTGNLGAVAQLIGEHYEEEGESKLREIVTILEPAITVGMGVIVAVVVLAVMLPMFDLTTFAQHGG